MPDLSDVTEVLAVQSGVISRAQLLGQGLRKCDIDRLVRRRELTRVVAGVYVDHTGPLTWRQRCWVACLHAGRAALHLGSAVDLDPSDRSRADVVHVAVDASRRVVAPPGVRVHRMRGLESMVAWHASPPRVRLEHVVLELAHRARTDADAVAVLCRAVGSRRTTAGRLAAALADRARLRRRALVTQLLGDLEHGTHSVLEHGYLQRVIRPHGLPLPTRRQAPRRSVHGPEYRDVEHADVAVVVELDGSRWHDDHAAADRDAWRDLDDLAHGQVVPRLRHAQVYGDPCRTAARLAAVFARRGWRGTLRACGSDCRAVRG